MWDVIVEDKLTRKRYLFGSFHTESEAEQACEQWGWSYDNGRKSYWMMIQFESGITERR